MIPRTWPSMFFTYNGEPNMRIYFLNSVEGLTKWTDYIPVNYINSGPDKPNSYDLNGYVAVYALENNQGKTPWIDYIPVFLDYTADKPWNDDMIGGYIPIGYGTADNKGSGSYLFYLGPTLVLDFTYGFIEDNTDESSYSLNLDFVNKNYAVGSTSNITGSSGRYWVLV